MQQVAKESQGLGSTFMDLGNAGEDKVLGATSIRENTKVTVFFWLFVSLSDLIWSSSG